MRRQQPPVRLDRDPLDRLDGSRRRRANRIGRSALALGLGLFLLACERVDNDQPRLPAQTSERSSTVSLTEKLYRAPAQVAVTGVRIIESTSAGGEKLTLRERYVSDGFGRFAIEPLELLEPTLSIAQEQEFLLAQLRRQGLLFRYRDFRVHDRRGFLKNHVIIDSGRVEHAHGRACVRWTVRARQAGADTHELLIDVDTGVVVRHERTSATGERVYLQEFESLRFGSPDPGVAFHSSAVEESVFANAQSAHDELGFEIRRPRSLPQRFQLLELARVVDPTTNRAWAKSTYTDGLEIVLLMQGDPGAPAAKSLTANVEPQVREAPTAVREDIGSWTVIEANLRSGDFVLMARTQALDLEALLRSL